MAISLTKDKMRFPNLQHTQKYILDGLKIEMWRENFYLEENEEMCYTGVENSFLRQKAQA